MAGDGRLGADYDRNASPWPAKPSEVPLNARTQAARELRRRSTLAESHLWDYLRAHRLSGYNFRRQYSIGPYVVDFICRRHQLIIEVDGEYHRDQVAADLERTRFLRALGYDLVRFRNEEIFARTGYVLRAIRRHLRFSAPPSDDPSP